MAIGSGAKAMAAGKLIVGWVALLWVLEVVDQASGNALDTFGVEPRRMGELVDVVPSAFMHFGFGHLTANTLPLLVLGFLAALRGTGRFLATSLIIIVTSGLGVWLTAPESSNTAGASGLIFGLFGYLLARGFVDRRITDLAVGSVVAVVYGSTFFWGVLPSNSGVSWQGHLFGLVGGILAARLTAEARAVGEDKPAWH
ncbi:MULTISPECIES: rhomboid family intramembrane serine protease [unclassified Streptomyces]|uniref:rhomboid family intramembrane serine protease n=1 Tax=unclassified Streptomyces TaxID=2593676 RepID=UPI002DDB8727|nr:MULTISPECIES: rhomboid family intramembrane serine protease [unclassified Streptomyces]WSA93110.1 rhomboid family intramembrane serine protease [Streptomyces sp. NBC_01795]WSB77481.1 rhomboid family intramembrane serine protease [Streptomyces sp. NBC_01775]WSS14254.1 rhomboid family intramembrane serine protease [Streptomyces sp. NBC_01186]WSS43073.1 rhomboid family intramembrane serine protease [Streptomyces sp. NBC_01187]